MQIRHLQLYSGNLDNQRAFYTEDLGLELVQEDQYSFSVQVGETILSFEETQYKPYYHFAINIPRNRISEALTWLKSRCSVLPFEGEEVVVFTNWKAKAVYFHDPDHNIVELIARDELDNDSNVDFDSNSFLEISEIGVPTTTISEVFESLSAATGLIMYDGDLNRFCAIGDASGLFIVVNYTVKDWIPTRVEAQPFPFRAEIEVNETLFDVSFREEEFSIVRG